MLNGLLSEHGQGLVEIISKYFRRGRGSRQRLPQRISLPPDKTESYSGEEPESNQSCHEREVFAPGGWVSPLRSIQVNGFPKQIHAGSLLTKRRGKIPPRHGLLLHLLPGLGATGRHASPLMVAA